MINKIFKKIIKVIIIIYIIVFVKLSFKIVLNKIFIANYPNNNNRISLVLMSMINIYEPYIAPYNYGNYYYQNGEYEAAYNKYQEALKYNIPRKRICSVRINIALTLFNIAKYQSDNKALISLLEAQEHLKACMSIEPNMTDEDNLQSDSKIPDQQQTASEITEEIEDLIEANISYQSKDSDKIGPNGGDYSRSSSKFRRSPSCNHCW